MEFDDLLRRYFGSSDLTNLTRVSQNAGVERMLVDLGLEREPGKRFALWSVLCLLGEAPALDVAFAAESEREAARNFMDLLASADAPSSE